MSRVQEELVGRIKDATDIVSLIDSYLPLRKRGKSYVALCPFHEEKTPSFHVNHERQSFKCFGCGKGGDVFSFLEEYEKVAFREALEMLAERAGIPLEMRGGREGEDEKAGLRRALRFALEQFCKNLETPEGSLARDYLRRRGILPDTVRDFALGFSPAGWDRLKTAARKAGFSEPLMAKAGLLVPKDGGGFYDRFRNRITIPIFDSLKRPLGFGARVLDQSEPKYLNSPEGPLFQKGNLLYGLERVRGEIPEGGKIGIVEGYTDVILAHQAGVKHLVATLGTSLTPEHAKALRRYARFVVLVFDGDEAGQKANARGVEILLEADLDVAVVILPEGLDPGDLVQRGGGDALREALEKETDFFDFSLRRLTKRYDLKTVAGRARAADDALQLVRRVPSPVKRDLLFAQVADRLGIAEKSLRDRWSDLLPAPRGARNSEKAAYPAAGFSASEKQEKICRIEEQLFGVLWKDPSILPLVRQGLSPEDLRGPGHDEIYREMLRQYEEEGEFTPSLLAERLGGGSKRAAIARWSELEFEEPARAAEQIVRRLRRLLREERIGPLKAEARKARKAGDEAAADASNVEIDRMLRESHKE